MGFNWTDFIFNYCGTLLSSKSLWVKSGEHGGHWMAFEKIQVMSHIKSEMRRGAILVKRNMSFLNLGPFIIYLVEMQDEFFIP